MKLPAFLVRTSYGYAFRLRVPQDLAQYLPQQSFKRSLRGYSLREAQLCALTLAARYAALFDGIRQKQGMADKSLLEQALEGARTGKRFEIGEGPLGRPTFKSTPDDTPESLKIGLEAFKHAQAAYVAPPPAPIPPPAPGTRITPIAAKLLAGQYLQSIRPSTKPKTWTIKGAAINGFVAHYAQAMNDPKALIHECTTGHVQAWVQMLNNSGLAPNTVNNKTIYVAHFFAWAMARGNFPLGPNIAKGHTTFSKKQQQMRVKEGYRAFTGAEIKALFDPAAFAGLSIEARWGMLLGFYTGARVSEIGQLRLCDFGIYETGRQEEEDFLPLTHESTGAIGKDWVYALRFTDEGPSQSLKTADSRRDIFIHPDLVTLGLIEHVETLEAAGKSVLFPKVKLGNVNGAGNWLSKAFSAYRTKQKVIAATDSKRKLGFHSFRKTINQEMQRLKVPEEYRERYLGHERQSVHGLVYSDYCPTALYVWISPLALAIDLDALKPLTAPATITNRKTLAALKAAIPAPSLPGKGPL